MKKSECPGIIVPNYHLGHRLNLATIKLSYNLGLLVDSAFSQICGSTYQRSHFRILNSGIRVDPWTCSVQLKVTIADKIFSVHFVVQVYFWLTISKTKLIFLVFGPSWSADQALGNGISAWRPEDTDLSPWILITLKEKQRIQAIQGNDFKWRNSLHI